MPSSEKVLYWPIWWFCAVFYCFGFTVIVIIVNIITNWLEVIEFLLKKYNFPTSLVSLKNYIICLLTRKIHPIGHLSTWKWKLYSAKKSSDIIQIDSIKETWFYHGSSTLHNNTWHGEYAHGGYHLFPPRSRLPIIDSHWRGVVGKQCVN